MNSETSTSEKIVKFSFYLLLFFITGLFLAGFRVLVIPALISILIYYILNPLVDYLESSGMPRILPILVLFIIIFIFGNLLFYYLIPPIYTKLSPLLTNWVETGNETRFKFLNLNLKIQLNDMGFNWEEVIKPKEWISKFMNYAKNIVQEFIKFIPSLITYLIITPIISFFLLLQGDKIFKNLISYVPNRFFEMTLMIIHKTNEQVTNYLKSLLIQGLIMTSVVTFGLYLLGFKYFIFFGLFAGFANSIPYLGPVMGFVPAALYTFLGQNNQISISYTLIVYLIAQIIDNFLVQPAIIAKAVSIHPLVMLAGVLIGGELFGIIGMFLAVPFISILKVSAEIMYKALREYKIL